MTLVDRKLDFSVLLSSAKTPKKEPFRSFLDFFKKTANDDARLKEESAHSSRSFSQLLKGTRDDDS